jgi:cell division protein FtsB
MQEHVVEPIKRQIAESVEQRSDQRLGFTARRAAILAAVVCVLTLTIAGPVRTYFAQRTEMDQLAASQAALRRQITDLEQTKGKLADPAYIAAQARERLGFVMPGDIPFQVQLPSTAEVTQQPGSETAKPANNDPWYTSLWHTIADAPHLPPANVPASPPAPAEPGSPGPVPPAAPNPTAPGG